MSLTALAVGFLLLLFVGYHFYARRIARELAVDDTRTTPAHAVNDGVDFVPTRPFYLFAQHFSAIAAAGPIAGPIMACRAFGWLPCLVWIALGVVLIGAVHDFATLTASVRHGARSLVEIAREQLGSKAGRAMLAFIWLALVYVIVAFADITAGTFVAGSEELERVGAQFHAGGAVAAASVMYLVLAVVMGIVTKVFKPRLWLLTAVFVPATFALSYFGTKISHWLVFDTKTWGLIILGYCALASVCPVWALLQPRGYLGGFVLYSALLVGMIGVLFGGYEIKQPMFNRWDVGGVDGQLFPFLFVTIACGACSGFHGLVCSGTTSKQIDRESHLRPVGYGAMLGEGFVALIALVTVMIVAPGELEGLKPGTIYGNGIGRFLTLLIGADNLPFAITFGAMAFSTFVFDTLDVCTRLGRYIIQELFQWRGAAGSILATLVTMAPPAYFLIVAKEGSYLQFWKLFGASNQLLAALSLLIISVWLARSGRRIRFTLLPMLFVLVVTLYALSMLVVKNWQAAHGWGTERVNAICALALVVLALFLVARALIELRRVVPVAGAPSPRSGM
ncbi:MAG: carbon starvation CstA family protein [Planctomycetota bacterium]